MLLLIVVAAVVAMVVGGGSGMDELKSLSVKNLKAIITEAGLECVGVVDREKLTNRALTAPTSLPRAPLTTPSLHTLVTLGFILTFAQLLRNPSPEVGVYRC